MMNGSCSESFNDLGPITYSGQIVAHRDIPLKSKSV